MSLASTSTGLVQLGEQASCLVGIKLTDLTPADLSRLGRFAELLGETKEGLVIRAGRGALVGKTRVAGVTLVCPPPMSASSFVTFVRLSLGADLRKHVSQDISSAKEAAGERLDAFLVVVALMMVREAEGILRTHIARKYSSRTDWYQGIKGRPIWASRFGRPPSVFVQCKTEELNADLPVNKAILSGLLVATQILHGTQYAEEAAIQVAIWKEMVPFSAEKNIDFVSILATLNRLSEHYEKGVVIARSLVENGGAIDVFDPGSLGSPHFELSMAVLFEFFVLRALKTLEDDGFTVDFKARDSMAIVDGAGDTYRQIEPDIIVMWQGLPIAVVDAKFKPRYLDASVDGTVPGRNKVTNADLYQLYFYQSRLQLGYRLKSPPAAYIAAPQLYPSLPRLDRRTIRWTGFGGDEVELALHGIRIPADSFPADLDNPLEWAASSILKSIRELKLPS